MQVPSQLKAAKLVWNGSQDGEWPSSNSETLRWLDTGHSDGVMLFESDTFNAMLDENRRLRDRVDALEWVLECEALPVGIVDWHPYFMTEAERPTAKAFDDAEAEIAANIAAARAAVEVE